jgi:hypothetical protein
MIFPRPRQKERRPVTSPTALNLPWANIASPRLSAGAKLGPKGIGHKSQACSAGWNAREAQDVGGSLPTHTAPNADGSAPEPAARMRQHANRLTG